MITVMNTRTCKQIKKWISDNITFDFFNFTRKSIAFVADSNNLPAIHMIISIKMCNKFTVIFTHIFWRLMVCRTHLKCKEQKVSVVHSWFVVSGYQNNHSKRCLERQFYLFFWFESHENEFCWYLISTKFLNWISTLIVTIFSKTSTKIVTFRNLIMPLASTLQNYWTVVGISTFQSLVWTWPY